MRTTVDVEDYSLSQTSLDEVFINFAARQKSSDDAEIEASDDQSNSAVPFTDHSVALNRVVGESRSEGRHFKIVFENSGKTWVTFAVSVSVVDDPQPSDFVVLRPAAKPIRKKRQRSLVPIADGEAKKAADTIVMLNHSPSSSSASETGSSPTSNMQIV